jgi:hypothetical protein
MMMIKEMFFNRVINTSYKGALLMTNTNKTMNDMKISNDNQAPALTDIQLQSIEHVFNVMCNWCQFDGIYKVGDEALVSECLNKFKETKKYLEERGKIEPFEVIDMDMVSFLEASRIELSYAIAMTGYAEADFETYVDVTPEQLGEKNLGDFQEMDMEEMDREFGVRGSAMEEIYPEIAHFEATEIRTLVGSVSLPKDTTNSTIPQLRVVA